MGLNNRGTVVGFYIDAAGATHGFIYANGLFHSIDDPEGIGATTVNGINDNNEIVGFFADGAGNTDGFSATSSHYKSIRFLWRSVSR